MFAEIIKRFARKAPAAILFRSLFARVYSPEQLDKVFHDYRERQVEGELLFSTLIRLLTPVVSGAMPAVHASYQELEEEMNVSYQAIYDKLQGVEPQVSAALLRIPTLELAAVRKEAKALKPDPVRGYHCYIIDGKRLDGTEHRLKAMRRLKSAPLPGTVLALLDTRLEMFVNVACDPDAYACERKVVLPLLEDLEAGALYLADRNFCDGPLIERFLRGNAFFILRHHGRSPRWRKGPGSRQVKVGQDVRGSTVLEQEVEVQLPDGSWYPLRRITVRLVEPTRDGDRELHVLSNLPARISAVAITDGYAGRWTIESCLGHVAQALNAEINTLAYPQAALLCFCLALVLFNMLSTLQALLLRFSRGSDKPQLSYYYLALEIAGARLGMEIVIQAAEWDRYARMSAAEFVRFAEGVVCNANLRKYRKHPRGPKRPQPRRLSGKGRSHVSAHRIIEAGKC
jgi:hypothetical protein